MAQPTIGNYSPWGPQNVTIPAYDPTLSLLVNFARNEKDYVFNKYVTRKTVKLIRGYYPNFYAPDLVRMQYPSDGRDMMWPWDQGRPVRFGNQQRFSNVNYEVARYTENGWVGDIAAQQSQWDLKQLEVNRCANKMLTLETAMTYSQFITVANWTHAWGTNTSTATVAGGGFWSAGTSTNPIIKKSVNYARTRILKSTIGKVKQEDLKLIIGPELATAMSETQEIHTYLQEQSGSIGVLEGKDPNAHQNWMLPNPLYGLEVMVEPAVYTTSAESVVTADTLNFIWDSNFAVITARPGSVNSELGGGSDFSTMHLLELKDETYTVYEEYIKRDKGTLIAVDLAFLPLLVAPQSGWLFTNTLS